jgi:hypothetical protein
MIPNTVNLSVSCGWIKDKDNDIQNWSAFLNDRNTGRSIAISYNNQSFEQATENVLNQMKDDANTR